MKPLVTKVQTDGTTAQRLECFTARVQIYPTAQNPNRKTANRNVLYKIFRYLHTILQFACSKILFFRETLQKYIFSVHLLHLYKAYKHFSNDTLVTTDYNKAKLIKIKNYNLL
jgi:hypothetical protein